MTIEVVAQQAAWLLLGAALVGMLARLIHVPHAVALVAAGLLVGQVHVVAAPRLEPNLLLFAMLPPLLFDASFRLDARELVRLYLPVFVLALPGVVVTALVVAAALEWPLGFPPTAALLFGSVVAATDPVAVTAVFSWYKVPGRLTTVVEAESLINDGVAIALFTIISSFVLGHEARPLAFTGLVVWQLLGGVLIGAALSFACSHLASLIDDHLLEMTLSTALAYGSYLLGQALGTSGALACVTAGLIHGSYGRQVGMSEATSRLLDDLWEYLGFVANALVFLLVGFSVELAGLGAALWGIAVVVAATLLARALVVLPPWWFARLGQPPFSLGERWVLTWSGLRGALTIALALALPLTAPERNRLVALAFGLVLFTLLVQALSLPALIRRAGLVRH